MEGFRHSSESQSLVFSNPSMPQWEAQRRLSQETQPSQPTFAPPSQPLLAPLPARLPAGRASSEELLQSIRHKEVLAAVEALRSDLREESRGRAAMAERLEELSAAVNRLESILLRHEEGKPGREDHSALTDSMDNLSPSEPMTVGEYLRWRTERAPTPSQPPRARASPADLLFS